MDYDRNLGGKGVNEKSVMSSQGHIFLWLKKEGKYCSTWIDAGFWPTALLPSRVDWLLLDWLHVPFPSNISNIGFVLCMKFEWLANLGGMPDTTSWAAYSHCWSRYSPFLKCNPKVNSCVHKSPPLVPILSQTNPIHIFQLYFLIADFNNTLRTRLDGLSSLFPYGYWQKLCLHI
jgi:hypothetical protein